MPLEFCPVSLQITYSNANEIAVRGITKTGIQKTIYQGTTTNQTSYQTLSVGVAYSEDNFFKELTFELINTSGVVTAPYIRYIRETDGYIIKNEQENP